MNPDYAKFLCTVERIAQGKCQIEPEDEETNKNPAVIDEEGNLITFTYYHHWPIRYEEECLSVITRTGRTSCFYHIMPYDLDEKETEQFLRAAAILQRNGLLLINDARIPNQIFGKEVETVILTASKDEIAKNLADYIKTLLETADDDQIDSQNTEVVGSLLPDCYKQDIFENTIERIERKILRLETCKNLNTISYRSIHRMLVRENSKMYKAINSNIKDLANVYRSVKFKDQKAMDIIAKSILENHLTPTRLFWRLQIAAPDIVFINFEHLFSCPGYLDKIREYIAEEEKQRKRIASSCISIYLTDSTSPPVNTYSLPMPRD